MPDNNQSSRFTNTGGNVFNFSNVGNIAGNVTGSNIDYSEQQTLLEAAREIQHLLQQLEQTNPTNTEAEKIAYVNDETTPSFKRRVASVLQISGESAIEELLDTSYVHIGKAIVKGWIQPE